MFSRPTQGEFIGVGNPKIPEQFAWISFIDTLAGGDVTKYELIYDLKYEECMYKLLYDHHKDKYTNEVNRRQRIQNKHLR